MAQSKHKSDKVFDEPQCLIYNDETGKMRICENVVGQIKEVEEQLNTIAIAGLYRTGKSYLMSRLAGQYGGFPLGSTVQSKTKGIWVWCRPHPLDKQQVLLLMDSEGLGDIAKGDADHDNKIFALITLLSATLIYNLMGVLNQDVLDKLNFITEISKNIKTSELSADDAELDMYFPELLLALRDCTLQMEIDGKESTPDEYFEHCLNLLPGDDKATKKKNRPRMYIRKYFKKRKCFTFERPGNRKVLHKLDDMEDKDLDEEFVAETKRFLEYVFNWCKPMAMQNGKAVNGRMFGNILESYVDSINAGGVPCIENALMSMAIIENQKAVEYAVQMYLQNMMKDLTLPAADDAMLYSAHQQCVALSVDVFLKTAVMDVDQEFQKKANKIIVTEFNEIRKQNDEASKKECMELLQKLHKPIQEAIKEGTYMVPGGYRAYKREMQNLEEKYKQNEEGIILGVKKMEALHCFLENRRDEGETILSADEQVTKSERQKEIEKHQKELAEKEAELLKQQRAQREEDFENIEKQTQENLRRLEQKQEQEMKRVLQHTQDTIVARLEEQERLMKEGHEKDAVRTMEEISRLKADNERKESMFMEIIKDMNSKAADAVREQQRDMEQLRNAKQMQDLIERSSQREVQVVRVPQESSGCEIM